MDRNPSIWTAEGELYELIACRSDIEEIAELLTAYGAADAAAETEELLCVMRHAERRISVRAKRLEEVWDAAYRVDAGKGREGQLDVALASYRAEVEPESQSAFNASLYCGSCKHTWRLHHGGRCHSPGACDCTDQPPRGGSDG